LQVNLYAGALFIQQALQWNLYVSVLLLLTATAFCTVTGKTQQSWVALCHNPWWIKHLFKWNNF